MKNEYAIINKILLEKKIQQLKNEESEYYKFRHEAGTFDAIYMAKTSQAIDLLTEIISQSIPLIPEIEKAFNVGVNSQFEVQEKNLTNKEDIRDYHQKKLINISNLKLDI